MIRYTTGNMFDAPAEALVNTVNLVGVMGKGVALQFKERFKDNFDAYCKACREHTIDIGHSLVTRAVWQGRPIWIINFPTKIHWRNPSQLAYVEKGLDDLKEIIAANGIKSIAIPPLGAGNGGLDWNVVKPLIVSRLQDIDCDIYIYEPGHQAVSIDRKVRLTPARALLTYMLAKMQDEGMDATAFAAVKLIYFLQKFGARPVFNLQFTPYIYGPYNDKVAHILHGIDGAYIRGFADMNKKPFEPFDVIRERMDEVKAMVESDILLKETADKTCAFLKDYWDDFSLELLSSIDYLLSQNPSATEDELYTALCAWTPRKARLFQDRTLTAKARNHILS